MKTILLLSLCFIIASDSICQQCPQSGLRIITADCGSPQNLSVKTTTCTAIEVQWSGNKEQTYVVEATCTDPTTKAVKKTEASKIFCDNSGCSATIPVVSGNKVNWCVTAICTIAGSKLYSTTAEGKEVYIPVCKKEPLQKIQPEITADKVLHVYPNPANGILNVVYSAKGTGQIELTIFDISRKQVFQISESPAAKENTYHLNLHKLANGLYLLQVKDGKDVNVEKFELFKN